ncbi:VCBS repeat-containing protein [Cellulomonas cellasea]|uniref:LamG-like jellyroll fold domain-containing protein n=1 Tax=Cellulomonas cellasea TaxID=43670 RepID=A0A7W4YBC3_9CELL|nr:VCBS repeat-containing protein [Cellulomonas cellasea]MBB2923528.1 hypothetical protein [Cellulomonas cellasea]
MHRTVRHGRRPGRAALPGILVTALVLAGLPAALPAAAASRPAEAPACTDAVPEADAAAALAQRCGTDVEVTSARTEWVTSVAQPDGTMRLDVSAQAVRARQDGAWVDVDNAVVPGDGGFAVASPVLPMTFSDGTGDEPLVRLERDGHTVSFDVPFDLPAPEVSGAELTYADVLPGVDLVVTVNPDATGFSEVLRVESAQAAAHPRLRELTFPVETSDGVEVRADDGGFVLADDAGRTVLASSTPAMWDSADRSTPDARGPVRSTAAPGAGSGSWAATLGTGTVDAAGDPRVERTVEPMGGEVVAHLPAEVTPDAVTIEPDTDLLTSPSTVWPVFIDPSVSGNLSRWAAVRTVYGTKYRFTGDEGVGLCSRATSTTCPDTYMSRLLWQFDGLQAVGDLDPADVLSATFAVTGTHSYSCAPAPVTLHMVSGFDQSVAYPGGTYWAPLHTLTVAHRAGCPAGQDPRRIEFDATAQGRAVAAANGSEAAFGIASHESTMANWKRYGWDATFSLTYNRAPSTPSAVRTTGPDSACVTGPGRPVLRSSPTLRAVVGDPDGGNVHADFDLVSAVNTAVVVWDPAATPAQGSGSEHAVQVPGTLNDGGLYQWRVRGIDPSGAVGPVVACEFAVDRTAPVQPTVATMPGQAAEYAEDAVRGGAGIPGLFAFSPAGSTDVVSYRYSFDSEALHLEVPASTPRITWTPPSGGPHRLYVQSVDAAGWTSPKREYRFTVDTASVSDAWRFDETGGPTAASAVPGSPNTLAVSASVTRVDGLRAELDGRPEDRALRFDEAADVASSATRVVDTAGTFGVMAYVKSDDAGRTAVAVSQDGRQVSGFSLGQLNDARCPTESKTCWAFWVPSSDATGATTVAAVSDVPVRAGYWVQLAAARTDGNRLTLSVCEIPKPTEDVDRNPVSAEPQVAPPGWAATGSFQVGRGRVAGAPGDAWRGAVGEVRTYTSGIDEPKLLVSCTNPQTILPVLDDPLPPTPPATNAGGNDFDGNGRADVFWVDDSGRWRVSYNGTTPWVVVNGAPGVRADQLRFGDLDGDGRDDVFFANPGDGWWIVSYGATSPWKAVAYAGVPNDQLALADVTGDGKDDVLWANPSTGVWSMADIGVSGWRQINTLPGVRMDQVRFSDVDGDGKDDVFFANPADGYWYVSSGATQPWRKDGYAGVPNDQLALGDLTGDGKADVLWANPADGTWHRARLGISGWERVNYAPGAPAGQLQLADVTGDGKDDVFFPYHDGRWLVSSGADTGWATVNTLPAPAAQLRVR